MHLRLRIFVLLLLVVTPASGTHRRAPTKIQGPRDGYVLALATANRFLIAWQTGDLETGMVLLSDRARQSQTMASLEQLFSPGANRAFEINHGKGAGTRYRFPVVMVSAEDRRVRRKFSEIILVKAGNKDWVVDRVP